MFRQYRPIERGEFILVGYDLAMGGKDYSAVQFLSKTKNDVPLVYHSKNIATQATNDIVPVLNRIYDVTGVAPVLAPETNAGGVYEIDRINAMNREGKFKMYVQKAGIGTMDSPDAKKYGYSTNTATRPKMLEELKNAIDNKVIGIYDRNTINEMFAFVVVKTSTSWKAQAEQGAHDDLIMSLAIAWQLYQTEIQPSVNNYVPKQSFNKWKIK